MALELLKEADYVLDACGRPVPPPGFKFVDLPRIIPFTSFVPGVGEGASDSTPTQFKVTNIANTLFICKGLAIGGQIGFRIKWPDGTFFNQNPFNNTALNLIQTAPAGRAGNMFALPSERLIEKGARIAVEQSGVNIGLLSLEFWGSLRYLLKETQRSGNGEPPGAYCIVGYPAVSKASKSGGVWSLKMMDDPITALEMLPRYACGPNQNIMAPEWALGDAPAAGEVPDGMNDESFTFFSDPINIFVNGQSYGNAVIVPGHEDVVLKRWRTISVWDAETDGVPVVGLRLPNGYSMTGGDLIPMIFDWMPIFPTLRVRAGGRIILDLSNVDSTTGRSITTTVEFDAVKRTAVNR